jgi:transposase
LGFAQLKQTELWLYDFDSQMLQQALADLRRAYINFFEHRARFPKFKKKKAARQPPRACSCRSAGSTADSVPIYRAMRNL